MNIEDVRNVTSFTFFSIRQIFAVAGQIISYLITLYIDKEKHRHTQSDLYISSGVTLIQVSGTKNKTSNR